MVIQHSGRRPVRIHSLRIRTANCGSRLQGHFLSPDPLLNQIYQIAAQSVISGVDDTFTDCPTFEQVNWNFDNRTAWQGEIFTSANHAIARHSIQLFAEDTEFPDLVRSHYPSGWRNLIPIYCFHWIMWCREYYRYSGDEALIRSIFQRIEKGIEKALGMINAQGLLEWRGDGWHFVEWGHGRDDNHPINSAEQAAFVGALEAAHDLGRRLGLAGDEQLQRWSLARQHLIEAVNHYLWDADRQVYVDSLHADGARSLTSTQTTNAALAVYGIADADRRAMLAHKIAADDPALLPFGSPYGLYYVMELLDSVGDVESIFRHIRHRWGDMVRSGDGTTWEQFAEFGGKENPTRSRCHPFAAYVIKYLVKYLLGIELLDEGYRRFHVRPRPPAFIDCCEGSIPTPHGPIRVRWDRHDGRINVSVEHPPGLERVTADQ